MLPEEMIKWCDKEIDRRKALGGYNTDANTLLQMLVILRALLRYHTADDAKVPEKPKR